MNFKGSTKNHFELVIFQFRGPEKKEPNTILQYTCGFIDLLLLLSRFWLAISVCWFACFAIVVE